MATATADPAFAADAINMDMDMDIDIDLGDIGDTIIPEPTQETTKVTEFTATPEFPSKQEEVELVPHKVNIRGVDDLSTKDLASYASEHFPDHKPTIEWINDTSVNFVFEDAVVARQALAALSGQDESNESTERAAKPTSSHPSAELLIRLATVTDKKQPRAREASRYYLLHPEEEKRNARRPQRRQRKSDDEVETFEASMYDDDESALATRRNARDRRPGNRRGGRDRDRSASPARSASPGGARYRRNDRRDDRPPRRRNSGKELFDNVPTALRAANNKAAAGTLKRELFPMKAGTGADDAADLFSSKMSIPLVDGAADVDEFPLRSDAIVHQQQKQEQQGFSIKGSATGAGGQGFSIRGTAGQKTSIRELFPDKSGGLNAGKELFGGRSARRNKAADLFG